MLTAVLLLSMMNYAEFTFRFMYLLLPYSLPLCVVQ